MSTWACTPTSMTCVSSALRMTIHPSYTTDTRMFSSNISEGRCGSFQCIFQPLKYNDEDGVCMRERFSRAQHVATACAHAVEALLQNKDRQCTAEFKCMPMWPSAGALAVLSLVALTATSGQGPCSLTLTCHILHLKLGRHLCRTPELGFDYIDHISMSV
jgi:hypothetical protein